MLYGLKRIPRWSSSLKTPQIPGCLQIQTGFAAPHEVQMSATGEQFVTLVQVWTEEGDEVRFDRAPLADIQTTGSECLLGGHRSIVPAARPETHPLLPWRWMSRLWCQASHRLFHIGDRKIHFLIVFFVLFLILIPCTCVISTRSTLTDGQQVKVVNGPLALVYLSDLS